MTKHTPGIEWSYHGYRVTEDGRIFSVSTNWRGYGRREMKQNPNSDGYPSVRLTINGKRKTLAVHKVVAEACLGQRPTERHEVRHLDGNKTNNCLSNICWGTAKDNADDRERHGRTSRGKVHSAAVLTGLARANQ